MLLISLGTIFSAGSNAQTLNAGFMTIPSFENGQLIVCVGEPVAFINTTIGEGPLATYSWDFGFGASSPELFFGRSCIGDVQFSHSRDHSDVVGEQQRRFGHLFVLHFDRGN